MSYDWKQIPVSGMCDVCGVNPATGWFGDTSCALCGDEACYYTMYADYQRHRCEMEAEDADGEIY